MDGIAGGYVDLRSTAPHAIITRMIFSSLTPGALFRALALLTLVAAIGCNSDPPVAAPIGDPDTTGNERATTIIASAVDSTSTLVVLEYGVDSSTIGAPRVVADGTITAGPQGGNIALHNSRRSVSIVRIADGAVLRTFTTIDSMAFQTAALSPDGTRIAIVRSDTAGHGREWLLVGDVDSDELTTVSDRVERNSIASFSPDGGRVAFFTSDDSLEVATITGARVGAILAGVSPDFGVEHLYHAQAAWMPSGSEIYFSAGQLGRIYRGTLNVRAPAPLSLATRYLRSPTINSAGTALVLSDGADIWTYTIATASLERSTATAERETYPDWNAGGDRVVYISDAGPRTSITESVADTVRTIATGRFLRAWYAD